MNIYSLFLHIHSGIRWLVLATLLAAVIIALLKRFAGFKRKCDDCIINRLAMILVHLQLLFGLVLYFISPKVIFAASSMKDPVLRFFLVEHVLMMLIAIALITTGYVKADRAGENNKKYNIILTFYSIGLALILAAIPWPFLSYGGGWF